MMREDRKDKVVRNEKIQNFNRKQKMEQINARMEKIEEMKREKYLLEEERKRIEAEMNNKKDIMMNRLSKVVKSDEYFTKDEIIDYVFNDKKPNTTKSMSNIRRINYIKQDKNDKNNKNDKNKNNKNDKNDKEDNIKDTDNGNEMKI